jgi:hypothetical protein
MVLVIELASLRGKFTSNASASINSDLFMIFSQWYRRLHGPARQAAANNG